MKIVFLVVKGLLSLIALALFAIGVARASLPGTCAVSRDQVERLQMEKMTYADVKAVLGCDGVLQSKQDFGGTELVIEDFSWRMTAWPYGRFDGHFINGVLHGKTEREVALQLS